MNDLTDKPEKSFSQDHSFKRFMPRPNIPNEPLTRNIVLSFHSSSMPNGHAGNKVIFDPQGREAVHKIWVVRSEFTDPETGKVRNFTRSEEEHLPIPPNVTTTWELWDYILEKRLLWFHS